MAKQATVQTVEESPRPRGRPRKTDSAIGSEAELTKSAIIDKAIALARQMPLSDISMVQLAREFDVAPGLIHYYIGNRDNLISGVLNYYYGDRVRRLPALTGHWRNDVEKMANVLLAHATDHPGIAQYIASHNRFRLFQQVGGNETDYGVVYFDYVAQAFLQGGFKPKQVALAFHLLMQFLVASSTAQASRQLPADHKEFIKAKFEELDSAKYPAAKKVGVPFSSLDSKQAFEAGLKLLLDGFAQWLK
ncbi:TetR/AcrR family transcriptional regulator [Noviherbaspirillum saxi]|uniref:TetR/AcrR family transcriptional regulator n=1 Tax=Noviherbaspirillum saxi TaxID=2320863 RepID=A0A3A3FJL6_9BURK|nr:TetR/AcrR family transcriptional regulator C-terminal domain-containing protein [Noviherbaspirillum saxi]RJF95487.1 TetR/AcrR family transcriptional regulator [Noviherbaspirillum saxi]